MKSKTAAFVIMLTLFAAGCADDDWGDASPDNSAPVDGTTSDGDTSDDDRATDGTASTPAGEGQEGEAEVGLSEGITDERIRFVVPAEPEQLEVEAMGSAEDEQDRTTADLAATESSDLSEPDLAMIAAPTCDALAQEITNAYQTTLDELGTAARTDVDAIDRAYESFGTGGRLIQERANELGCSPSELGATICAATAAIESRGEAGEDLVGRLRSSC